MGKSHRGLLSRGGDGAVRGRGARPKYWRQIRSRREEWKTVILLVYFYFYFLCVCVCVKKKKSYIFVDTLGPSFFSLEWLTLSAMLESSLGRVFAGSTWVPRAAVPTSIVCRRSCLGIGHPTRTTRDQGNQGPRPFLLACDLGIGSLPLLPLILDSENFWNPVESSCQGQDELKGKRSKTWPPPAPLMAPMGCHPGLWSICVFTLLAFSHILLHGHRHPLPKRDCSPIFTLTLWGEGRG